MISGIGIDLVSIPRIARMCDRFGMRFESRIFTSRELVQARGRAIYLAGRFAVKEALLKALGTGFSGGVRWQEIETIGQESGAPEVRCYGKVLSLLDSKEIVRVWTSITHERDQVVALVVLEKTEGSPR